MGRSVCDNIRPDLQQASTESRQVVESPAPRIAQSLSHQVAFRASCHILIKAGTTIGPFSSYLLHDARNPGHGVFSWAWFARCDAVNERIEHVIRDGMILHNLCTGMQRAYPGECKQQSSAPPHAYGVYLLGSLQGYALRLYGF